MAGTADKNALRMILNALTLHPYAPGKNTPQDIGLGGPSTEYLATGPMYGGVINYPTIWWTDDNKPVLMDPDQAWQVSKDYQDVTGQRFPQFDNKTIAEWAAKSRSAQGGAEQEPLVNYLRAYIQNYQK